MANTKSKPCPDCWSTLDPSDAQCPHCGAVLQRPRGKGIFIGLLTVAILAGGATGGWWWFQQTHSSSRMEPAREDTSKPAKIEPATTPTAGQQDTPPVPIPLNHHWIVYTSQSRRAVLLAALASDTDSPGSRSESRTLHYCVPAIYLPTKEGLQTKSGAPIEFRVLTWERRSDLVLLAGPAPDPMPNGFTPISTRPIESVRAGEPLLALAAGSGKPKPVQRQGAQVPMSLSELPVPGSIVKDEAGRGIAYVTPDGGTPLHWVTPWFNWRNTMALEDLQKQIRETDPRAVLVDARKFLSTEGLTIARARQGVSMLERCRHMRLDRDLLSQVEKSLRFGHLQLIRVLSASDGVLALQQARESVALYGTDKRLLADAIHLALLHGTSAEAIQFFQQLQGVSPDHALREAEKLGRSLSRSALRLMRESRNQEAGNLLQLGVQALPTRPDLRLLYARALKKLGSALAAEFQANEASRLDSSYASKARAYRTDTRGNRGRRVVEIPMPAGVSTILTTGNAGGQQMSFVVDTGASYTTVPTSVARALGLLNKNNPKVRLTTASGVITTERVVLKNLTVAGKLHLKGVRAVVHDLPGNLANKGLLGLNVLRKLNMRIKSDRSVLVLSQKRR